MLGVVYLMEAFGVQFKNMQTGQKEYREYPKMSQFKNRESLCNFLNNRNFLTGEDGWIVETIKGFDSLKEKMKLAEQIGRLVYF